MGAKQRLRAMRRETGDQNLSVKVSVAGGDDDGGIEVELNDAALDQSAFAADDGDQAGTLADDDGAGQVIVAADDGAGGEDPLEPLRRQLKDATEAREAAERKAFEEAQRARDYEARLQSSSKEREEAETAAQERAQEYEQQLRERAAAGFASQKASLEHAYASEELKLANAKRSYAEMLRIGDFDAAAEANAEIARTTQTMAAYSNSYHGIEAQEQALVTEGEERVRAPVARREAPAEVQPAPQQSDQFESALTAMHPKVAAWAREHKDDILRPDRQKLAFAADALALAKGLPAGSDEYLDLLDEHMGYLDTGTEPEPVPVPVAQNGRRVASKRPTAAPASRATASSGAIKVHLSDWDREQAKLLGQSEREYATFKVKSTQGQLTPGQAGGRLMARYSA
jgi:hypothetical protein